MKSVRLERGVGLVLGAATAASVGLLALGVAGLALSNVGPLDRSFPSFDLARLAADVGALKPAGFLWLGLLAVILTPSVRVAASCVGFVASRERAMAAVALVVLAVICLSAVVGAGG